MEQKLTTIDEIPGFDIELMKAWVNSLQDSSKHKADDYDKFLKIIHDCVLELSQKGFFKKESFDVEAENYFISTLGPCIIKNLLSEKIKDPVCRRIARDILEIFLTECAKNMTNVKLNPIWESVVLCFNENHNYFFSHDSFDVGDKFWELIYTTVFPDIEEWKKTLEVGKEIDILLKEEDFLNNTKTEIGSWTRGTILDFQGTNLKVEFKGIGVIKTVGLNSCQILPLNTFSSDFEWRESLKTMDEFDFLDSRSWYLSTAIDIPANKRIRYALRIFRPNGKSTDKITGNKYYGWSETFDAEVSCHHPRIRK